MIGFFREDGEQVWITPEHVTLIEPVTKTSTRITLAGGSDVIVKGTAYDVAVEIAADGVTQPGYVPTGGHPLEIE